MTLEPDTCYRAIESRDTRFEGRFVVAVKTTGVFCRPGCPARTPKRSNVVFLPSPAAAEAAGFRPCLRCRPDASPETPAWTGTAATVARALRVIAEGGAVGGVDALALRLGLGARHLRRLFLEHLGAPPIAIVNTRRVHFARQLIEDTALPFGDIAHAAGFGSVRRFNTAVRRAFGRAPGALRGARRAASTSGETLVLRLPFKPPYDWDALIGFLAARAIPGVEHVTPASYRRTVRHAEWSGSIEVTRDPGGRQLLLRVAGPPSAALMAIADRTRAVFDLGADPHAIAEVLAHDPLLARALERHPGIRVPGAWDPFELGVRAILGQQVTVRGATTLAGRLVRAYGTPVAHGDDALTMLFPEPATLADAPLETIGLPGARASALRGFAAAVADGRVSLTAGAHADDVVRSLASLPGLGAWTAEYIAMRALGEPDAFPTGDLVLRRMAAGGGEPLTSAALTRRADAWRPWRAYAALLLWTTAGDER